MTKKDKNIIDSILTYIGSDSNLEDIFAKDVGMANFDMTADEFSEWLVSVKIKD